METVEVTIEELLKVLDESDGCWSVRASDGRLAVSIGTTTYKLKES